MSETLATPSLSALIITYNEIGNIGRCIDAVQFADEIVVVDSYSTDGTYEYLQADPRVRVIRRPFQNFTDQKNFALGQATHDWVLFVDADEVVGERLQGEIREVLRSGPPDIHAYWFYRRFMFRGKPLRFSGWQTDRNVRLFRRSRASYTESRLVHEQLDVAGRTGVLKTRLTHYCYNGFAAYRRKMLMYGRLKATQAVRSGKRFSWALQILKPLWKFGYNYLVRLGFLDGLRGITICYLGALEDLERYRYLRKLEQAFRKPKPSWAQPGARSLEVFQAGEASSAA